MTYDLGHGNIEIAWMSLKSTYGDMRRKELDAWAGDMVTTLTPDSPITCEATLISYLIRIY